VVVEPAPVTISPTAPIAVVQPGLPPISNPGGAIAMQVIHSLLNTAGYEWSLVQVGDTSGYVPAASICL
jgi:hypothetical protein